MLIDTNVWSELTRRAPDVKVAGWVREHFDRCLLSTLVVAEMRYGLERADNEARRAELTQFHDDLLIRVSDRLVAFDLPAASAWAKLKDRLIRTGQIIAEMDMLIAAQALALGVPLVTRNSKDMHRTGAPIIDPWQD